MFGEIGYLDSLDHFKNFCDIFYNSKISSSLIDFEGLKVGDLDDFKRLTVSMKKTGK